MGSTVTVVIVVLVFLAMFISWTIKHLLYICAPNEVLIFSGTRRQSGNRTVGYKIIKGGRAVRKPLFEVVDRMDLTNMPIDLEVKGAYSKGGIPLNVVGIANVKIAGHQPILDNAIERFLGKSRNEIILIAKETLEGTLRGVLATLTPEEVNEDKMKFAEALLEEATDDLNRLGLALDTLKIQDVSDDVQYLDSIGRKRSAEIQRRARIAEAEATAKSRVKEAENFRAAELRRISAQTETVKAENERRIADAQTKGKAMIAEQRGQVAALLAQAKAEVQVQAARIERERRRLTADVLEPARAEKQRRVNQAKADAAIIVEQGRAQAEAMTHLAETWKTAGSNARDVFLMQKLDAVMTQTLRTMKDLPVDKVTVLGVGHGAAGGAGEGLAAMAPKLVRANEELKAALGVDLANAVVTKLTGKAPGGTPKLIREAGDAPSEAPAAAPPPAPEAAYEDPGESHDDGYHDDDPPRRRRRTR